MKFGTLCSGIEGAAVAFAGFGWEHAYCTEVDPFCCQLLAHHYPGVPNLGDITTAAPPPVDLIVAGTPCQSFSVAGRRGGMDDPRGRLALRFVELLATTRPRWIVWENVPGVLSSGSGADFLRFVAAITEVGYGVAWRILDARFFGVAQRRRRVFVVGHLGDWRPAAECLFEAEARRGDAEAVDPLREGAKSVSRGVETVFGFSDRARPNSCVDETPCLCAGRATTGVIGFAGQTTPKAVVDLSPTLMASTGGEGHGVISGPLFRRLTVTEWERLQGFPDGYTAIGRGDSLRRKALGNSFAVPVIRWVGRRLKAIHERDALCN